MITCPLIFLKPWDIIKVRWSKQQPNKLAEFDEPARTKLYLVMRKPSWPRDAFTYYLEVVHNDGRYETLLLATTGAHPIELVGLGAVPNRPGAQEGVSEVWGPGATAGRRPKS